MSINSYTFSNILNMEGEIFVMPKLGQDSACHLGRVPSAMLLSTPPSPRIAGTSACLTACFDCGCLWNPHTQFNPHSQLSTVIEGKSSPLQKVHYSTQRGMQKTACQHASSYSHLPPPFCQQTIKEMGWGENESIKPCLLHSMFMYRRNGVILVGAGEGRIACACMHARNQFNHERGNKGFVERCIRRAGSTATSP